MDENVYHNGLAILFKHLFPPLRQFAVRSIFSFSLPKIFNQHCLISTQVKEEGISAVIKLQVKIFTLE